MDFGIFILMQQRNKHKTSHQILRDAVEQTRLADELGFGGAWFAEHHFSNYGMCSSPLTMIAHCAAVTRNIRLGTGIVVAPLYTPARLIADVAMVDQLSDGRLNLDQRCNLGLSEVFDSLFLRSGQPLRPISVDTVAVD